MELDRLNALRANMFPAAQVAIDDWNMFPWHRHATSRRSSQMLAIDIFGTLKTVSPPVRDEILRQVALSAGLQAVGPWEIHLEWQDNRNLLREYTPTQVDAAAISADTILLFECKFTEAGGNCSMTNTDTVGRAACNGTYAPQVNPRSNVTASCALSGKGIAYWDWIERIYGIPKNEIHAPCPFAFDAYQWMRNTVLAAALREADNVSTRVFAAYAYAPHLKTSWKVENGKLGVTPLDSQDTIIPLPYSKLLDIAVKADPDGPWQELTQWVKDKILSTAPITHKSTVSPIFPGK